MPFGTLFPAPGNLIASLSDGDEDGDATAPLSDAISCFSASSCCSCLPCWPCCCCCEPPPRPGKSCSMVCWKDTGSDSRIASSDIRNVSICSCSSCPSCGGKPFSKGPLEASAPTSETRPLATRLSPSLLPACGSRRAASSPRSLSILDCCRRSEERKLVANVVAAE